MVWRLAYLLKHYACVAQTGRIEADLNHFEQITGSIFPMKLTLDWNCVIEVEEQRSQAFAVMDLIDRHRKGQFEVALLAASASENNKSRRFPGNAKIFNERVAALGWSDLPLVLMPGIYGLSYFDYCFYVGDGEKFKGDMAKLWLAIAPNVKSDPSCHLPAGVTLTDEAIQSKDLAKWRNTWCDVISAYSHIHAKRDAFVTRNTSDFQKNSEALGKLGMKHIFEPADVLEGLKAINGKAGEI